MNNIIQYFSENGIEELEKIKLNFLKDPSHFEVCVMKVLGIFLKMACILISERLEECNTMLEASLKRQSCWHIKDRCKKSILTPDGTVYFTHTCFINKKTKETAYLLDRIMGWKPHTRLSDGVKTRILEAAAQCTRKKVKYLYVEADENHIAL